jgi:hypothetical protein
MNKYLGLLVLVAITPHLIAQPTIQWQRCLGGSNWDAANALIQTSDGSFLVAAVAKSDDGDVSNPHGEHDCWLIKMNDEGSILWEKTYGGSGYDVFNSVQELNEGGYIVAGSTSSYDGDVVDHHGASDLWLLKTDTDGNLLWKKTFGGSTWDGCEEVLQTTDGGFILTGYTESNDGDVSGHHGLKDFWVVKLSSTGAIQWQKALGGTGFDNLRGIVQSNDGGYLVIGETYSSDGDIPIYRGQGDCWAVKLDENGATIWSKTYGGTGNDTFIGITKTHDGRYLLVGNTSSSDGDVFFNHGDWDCWVVKMYDNGEIEWQKTFGGTGGDRGFSVQETADNNFIIAGITTSHDGDVTGGYSSANVWVFKISTIGDLQWQKPLGGDEGEYGFAVCQTQEHGYLVCGVTHSSNGDVSGYHASADGWVVKLSPESSSTYTPQELELSISPNPASQLISIQIPTLSAVGILKISITDLLGRKISEQTISYKEPVNIAALPNAVYLLTATTPLGIVYSGKFTKQ